MGGVILPRITNNNVNMANRETGLATDIITRQNPCRANNQAAYDNDSYMPKMVVRSDKVTGEPIPARVSRAEVEDEDELRPRP